MSEFYEYDFKLSAPEAFRDIFTALLANAGFEGFVETTEGFLAYTNLSINPDIILSKISEQYSYSSKVIKEKNWNQAWEQHIKPLIIDDKIYIKTSFHPDKKYPIVITIDPKMSFGTGHHETTYLMIKQLLELNLHQKSVIDMGTGTGVLAILSKKLGAGNVFAIDNDKWAYQNMIENFNKNQTSNIISLYGDASNLNDLPEVDFLLANINRNILLKDLSSYFNRIKLGGHLILSGFYTEDIPIIKAAAEQFGMIFESKKTKNNWSCLKFTKI